MKIKLLLLAFGIMCLTFACTVESQGTATSHVTATEVIDIGPIEEAPPACDDDEDDATWTCGDLSTLDCRGKDWGAACQGMKKCNAKGKDCERIGEDPVTGASICR